MKLSLRRRKAGKYCFVKKSCWFRQAGETEGAEGEIKSFYLRFNYLLKA